MVLERLRHADVIDAEGSNHPGPQPREDHCWHTEPANLQTVARMVGAFVRSAESAIGAFKHDQRALSGAGTRNYDGMTRLMAVACCDQ
jgi:hypothetical protein